MPLNLDYFYGGESEQYSFYRIPKVLFTAAHYRAVPVEAKVLYGLLLDRMALSARNGWLDEGRRVFIYFTLEDAMAMMGCGHNKAVRLFADLEQIGLIERRKQGQGRPTRIYVKNFILPTETGEPDTPDPRPDSTPPAHRETSNKGKSEKAQEVLTSQNRKSGLPETGSPDFPKTNANKTDKNKTELNDTDLSIPPSSPRDSPTRAQRQQMRMDEMDSYRELIKENISYDLLLQENFYDDELIDGYVELMVDACCSKRPSIRISGEEIPTEVVRSRFLKLDKEHIGYVMDSMRQNTTRIANIRAYMLSALYNAPVTINQYYTSLVSHDMAHGFQ